MRMIVVRPVYLMELVIGINNEFQVIVVHPMTSKLPPRPETLQVAAWKLWGEPQWPKMSY